MAPHKQRRKFHKNNKKRNEKKKYRQQQVTQVNKEERENLITVKMNVVVADNLQKHLDDYMLVKYSTEQTQPVACDVVKEEPTFVEQELSFILDSQVQSQIKSEKLDPIEKIVELGGGLKRKRLMKIENFDYNEEKYVDREPANDVEKCMTSCLEDVKLLISNLPANFTQPDLVRLFAHYNSLQCTYMVDNCDDASSKSLPKAVLIFNDRVDAKQVIKDYNGLLLDDCDLTALKVELISSMRRYEYGSPLNLIHYQVVKSPSMFKQRNFNCSTIKRENL